MEGWCTGGVRDRLSSEEGAFWVGRYCFENKASALIDGDALLRLRLIQLRVPRFLFALLLVKALITLAHFTCSEEWGQRSYGEGSD